MFFFLARFSDGSKKKGDGLIDGDASSAQKLWVVNGRPLPMDIVRSANKPEFLGVLKFLAAESSDLVGVAGVSISLVLSMVNCVVWCPFSL